MKVVRINDAPGSTLAIVPSVIAAVELTESSDTRYSDQLMVGRGSVTVITAFAQRLDVVTNVPVDEARSVYRTILAAIENEPDG